MQDFTKETINKIQELVEARVPVIDLADGRFLVRDDYNIRETPIYQRSRVSTNSLLSLIEFAAYTMQKEQKEGYLIEVVDEKTVRFYEPVNEKMERNCLLQCYQADKASDFLNKYIDPETMIINLRRVAAESMDFEKTITVISGISNKQEVTTTDDGIGQTTTLVRGNTVVGSVDIKSMPILELKRTFNELPYMLEQFVLRVKDGKVALFTANSNQYECDYRNHIRGLIKTELLQYLEQGVLLVI